MNTAQTQTASTPHLAANGAPANPREVLSFRLGDEEYGIDILRVQEIRGYEAPTRIANVPHFIKGVVNLRGVIVPVVDMRLRFGMSDVQYNDFTVVIVLNVASRTIGVVVDSVSDVLELPPQQVRPAPEFNSAVDPSFITGIATLRTGEAERMLILMDIESLMRSPEMCLAEPGLPH